VALLHSIGQWDGPGINNRWIGKHIFPGACCPSALSFDAFAIPAGSSCFAIAPAYGPAAIGRIRGHNDSCHPL
jgi:hypothetical protein